MTIRTLIFRSLRYRWRAHLGVVLGAAVGSAALIGALVVGDSVRESLRERALARLGWVETALDGGDRLFPQELATRVVPINRADPRAFNSWNVDAVLKLPGMASRQDGTARANHVNVLGVDYASFWQSLRNTNARPAFALVPKGSVVLNEALAAQLHAQPGDEIVLRLPKPTALSRDVPITPQNDASVALRLKVHGIATAPYLANFSLRVGQTPPLNAFLLKDDLASAAGLAGKANLILAGDFRTSLYAESMWRRWWDRIKTHLPGYKPVSRPVQPAETKLTGWRMVWPPKLADYSLNLRLVTNQSMLELHSERIFLEPPVEAAVFAPATNQSSSGQIPSRTATGGVRPPPPTNTLNQQLLASLARPVLTYLVNQLRAGTNATPYSMVAAAGQPWTPPDLRDDEILVNQWLADDLRVQPGNALDLTYFLAESGTKLVERTNRFRVRGVVPLAGVYADRTLMPEFPGLAKAESTHEWDAGFPLTHKIRDQDEQYWKQYRGTPKAFVTLRAGQAMWGNRFGRLTAIRFPLPAGGDAGRFLTEVENTLTANLDPASLGLRFEPVREQALAAANQSQDFGQLFLGFSFFLIAAALILMGLLFQFGLEQRAPEVGTLLALGFTPRQVRRLLLWEGSALALAGGVIGALGGLGYARAMLHGLTTIWRDAVGASSLSFHVTGHTLLIGLASSTIVSALTIWLAMRKFVKQPARELLAGEIAEAGGPRRANVESTLCPADLPTGQEPPLARSADIPVCGLRNFPVPQRSGDWKVPRTRRLESLRYGRFVGCIKRLSRIFTNAPTVAGFGVGLGLGLVAWAVWKHETANAEIFFSAGTLFLIGGVAAASWWLRHLLESESRRAFTLGSLGVRGCTRRRKRSLAVIALLACGSFLVASIGVFRLDANVQAWRRSSGTGGFALIGQSTLPVVKDLNTTAGQDFFDLDEKALTGVSFVPFRVHDGDEASCLNLNRAQQPRLLGVKPELLAERGAFSFAGVAEKMTVTNEWLSLKRPSSEFRLQAAPQAEPPEGGTLTEIPAIGDAAAIEWAMGKKLGDTIDYTDEHGRPFKLRLVGAVANSILQGSLIIDEAEFVKRFPGEAGYRMFLIDAPSNRVAQVSAALSRGLQDVGLELTPAAQRLAQFNAVQNTYLNTFQVLGGLGLLLGSAGLGVVVLRNVLERRAELALLLAVGFRQRTLHGLVLGEHGALLGVGLAVGLAAAAVAVLPAVLSPAAELPWRSLGVTLGGVVAAGLLAAWIATRFALRGQLLEALRSE